MEELLSLDLTPSSRSGYEESVQKFLNRYYSSYSHQLEDSEWVLHNSSISNKYDLKPNEFVFDNSTEVRNKDQEMLLVYLDNIKRLLRTIPDLKTNVVFHTDEEYNITWVIIKCSVME